jgi:fumarate reductase (CoM/CoB) subunit B
MRSMTALRGITPTPVHVNAARYALETGRIIEIDITPITQSMPGVVETDSSRDKVGLFLGCMINYHPRLQDWGRATLEVLKRLRVSVLVPKDQVCCGMPMIYSGQLNAVKGLKDRLVKHNIQTFEALGVDTVLALCPACTRALKNYYPIIGKEIMGRTPRFKIMEFTEYLAQNTKLDYGAMSPVKMRITYHDPCHLRRSLGIYKEPREIITGIPGIDFKEMAEPELCCGAGGGVREAYPEIAAHVVQRKIDMIAETGAGVVVTECPSCHLELLRGLRAGKLRGVKVLTIPQLILKAYF